MGDSKKSRLLTLVVISGLWQACLINTYPQTFMMGFPDNKLQKTTHLRITVTNSHGKEITVSIASYIENLNTYVLQPQASTTTIVAEDFMVKGSTKTKQGVRITSSGKANVYMSAAKEWTLVIPERFLGSFHYVVSEGNADSEILLVGVTNRTRVAVTIRTTTNAIYNETVFFNGETINESLDEFDTVQIQSDSGDLTGTLITASSPISVFSANPASDHAYLLEQIPARIFWHTEFVTVPPMGSMYDCKIVAAFPGTSVEYHCGSTGWQNVSLPSSGSHTTLQLDSAICTVIASRPILVTMFMHGATHGPSMVVLQPVKEVYHNITFYVPESLEPAQIILVTHTEDISNITLDNATMNEFRLSPIDQSHVSVVETITAGTHIIKTSGFSLRISGYIFGWLGTKTYAFSLIFQGNVSDVFDTRTTASINGAIYNSITTTLTDGMLDTATVRNQQDAYTIAFEKTADINFGTSEPTTATVAATVFTTSEPTTGTTAATFIPKSEATTETTAATVFATSEPTTATAAVTFIPKSEATTETTAATFIPKSEATSETTIASVFATSDTTTETTAATFETTTTETKIETSGNVVGTAEPTNETSVVDGTPIVATLMPLGRTTAATAAELTTIDGNTSPVPKRPNGRPMLCGTTSANTVCLSYCSNRTVVMNVRLVDMRANLIDRKSTRRYMRTLTSAVDDRMSAQTIGYTGVIVLVSVVLFIVILDLKAGKTKKKRIPRNPI